MTRTLLASFLILVTSTLQAQEPIRFARSPALSPDGKTVAFSYLGDLWTVDAKGGVAHQLTRHEKHDFNPIYSPDGQWIAFSSNRHGQYDVFVVPVKGGRPKRLTFDSADDHVTGWSPDSQNVLFMSGREIDLPFRTELFTVPVTGGQPKRISVWEGRDGAYSPKGDLIAHVRGPGRWYRRGYHGSANDDIWLCNADGSNNRQITTHKGQDIYPMWSADGKSLFYVSDVTGGQANIVKKNVGRHIGEELGGGPLLLPVAVTHHKDDFVRRARISANGQSIVYECGFDIWIHSIKDGKSRKLNIEVNADDQTNTETLKTFTTGTSEFAWSPDEKHVAFVVHGEIFLMPRNGGKAKRLTNHPAFDHGIAWSPDGKQILFLSDRSGHEDIYSLEPDDPDHPSLLDAHRYKIKQLTDTPEAEFGVMFSPDGKHVTFVRAGKLMQMDPDGGNQKTLVSDGQIFDYEWSPDSRWICYARADGSFASELFIIPATGATAKEPARNITRFATYNGGVTWSQTGNKLGFVSTRKGGANSVNVLSLQKPLAAGAFPNKEIDWENIHLRVKQPAPGMISQECVISNDGTKVAFRAEVDGSEDLWIANADGGSVTRLTTGNLKPTQIQWSRFFFGQIYFRDGNGNCRAIMIGGPALSEPNTLKFTAKMTVRQDEVFLEMFDQGWRALHENFYDANFHGANWKAILAKYRPVVQHCAMKEDLYTLIALMLGELNASHLGITGNLGSPDQQTANLGLIFDHKHPGSELKIVEILKGGPADQRGINLKAGDRIVAIDRVELTPQTNVSKLLNDKAGEVVALKVTNADGGSPRRVEIRAETRAKLNDPMYERWIARNAQRVNELSKGKLGYIHIPNMQEPGLERFVRALYSENFDKEGIVLDVRYNGGGFTHDQVLNYLTGKEHTLFVHRDGTSGLVFRSYDRKWHKPLTLLINNRSFSDAEIFPAAFRTLGLGKLVGEPTGGLVIGTRGITLIDGSTFSTPRIGIHTIKGVNMEKEGVMPDITLVAHPDDLARGHDAQLEKAVEVLREEVIAWKKTRPPAVGASGATNP
ncbi:MAG: PDZ domain-containing protein [Gemmataceae bacterium]|nr:PDZ domain-containing protein [Gemmataceae bacterium]